MNTPDKTYPQGSREEAMRQAMYDREHPRVVDPVRQQKRKALVRLLRKYLGPILASKKGARHGNGKKK